MQEYDQKDQSVYNSFGIIIYFLEVGARILLKVATKVFLELKKLLKLWFLDYFYKAKTEECDQEDWSVSYKFEITTPCSATYHLEGGAPFSLKVPTKVCFVGKKTLKI